MSQVEEATALRYSPLSLRIVPLSGGMWAIFSPRALIAILPEPLDHNHLRKLCAVEEAYAYEQHRRFREPQIYVPNRIPAPSPPARDLEITF